MFNCQLQWLMKYFILWNKYERVFLIFVLSPPKFKGRAANAGYCHNNSKQWGVMLCFMVCYLSIPLDLKYKKKITQIRFLIKQRERSKCSFVFFFSFSCYYYEKRYKSKFCFKGIASSCRALSFCLWKYCVCYNW